MTVASGNTESNENGETSQSKARYYWSLIRSCISTAVTQVAKAHAREINIRHGIQHTRHILHPHGVTEVIYNRISQEYVSVDGTMLRIFDASGRKKSMQDLPNRFSRLLCAQQLLLYVGWTPNKQDLYLMDDSFHVSSISKAVDVIHCVLYNESAEEVVTVGPGYVTSWVFRYGGRHLLPRNTTREGINPQDTHHQACLEQTASRQQKLFAACHTAVMVVNIYEGRVITYAKDLHTRQITAISFFNPLKYLITGSKDGSIKVWNDSWHVQLVFVGHEECVTSLALYPYGPYIVSTSHDNTIRVWSLESCDQVDRLDTDYPVENLTTEFNRNDFYSISGTCVDLWSVVHIHSLHTAIGSKVTDVKCTDHPHHPIRSVVKCRDSTVHIVSPTTGDVITSLVNKTTSRLKDAAYSIGEDLLFTVYEDGTINKIRTSSNPCEILDTWPCPDQSKVCNYLLMYEYIITSSLSSESNDKWAGMSRAVKAKGVPNTQEGGEEQGRGKGTSEEETNEAGDRTAATTNTRATDINRILLLGGRRDGHICVFNRDDGHMEFEIEAHGTKGVLSMCANSKNDLLISAGLDNIIKVWRLYPYAQESLAPLMSFYCAHTPVHMSTMRSKLVVAFQEHISATYSVVMYNLKEKNRLDHSPDQDHMDSIMGLASCAKMKLVASCSLDGTLKIWTEENQLLRCIKLNVTPTSIAFCSQRGDLLIGVGKHLHLVDQKAYMPRLYRQRMVAMKFLNQEEEKALPYDERLTKLLTRDEMKRLKAARASFKFTHFVDILTEEETDEVMKEKRERAQEFSKLKAREEELALIRDGNFKMPSKRKPTKSTRDEAFENYLKLFYDRPKVEVPTEEDYMEPKPETPKPPKYQPPVMTEGFFPDPSTAAPDDRLDPGLVRLGGYVPNSIIVRLLWPQVVDASPRERWRPPGLSDEQVAALKAQNTQKSRKSKKFDEVFRETTLFLDYDDDEPKAEESDGEPEEQDKEQEEEEEEQADIMSKLQGMIKAPIEEEEHVPEDETTDKEKKGATTEPSPPAPSTEPPLKPTPKPPKRPVKKLEKRPSRRVSIKSPDAGARTRTPPTPDKPDDVPVGRTPRRRQPTEKPAAPSPPPARPATPLPEFISQFIGLEWFDKYFPNCNTNTMPKPWTVSAFVSLLIRVMKVAEYSHKVDVARAMSYLHKSHGIENQHAVSEALFYILRRDTGAEAPGSSGDVEQTFVISALQLLHLFDNKDLNYYVELIAQFLDGDKAVRAQVLELLKSRGMKDRHNHLVKELDSWDIWSLGEGDRKQELRKMAADWLEKWLVSYKRTLEVAVERLKKGQPVTSKVLGKKQAQPESKGGILKKAPGETPEEKNMSASMRQVTVTFEASPGSIDIDNISYIEAINYFCEMETERDVERLRNGGISGGEKSAQVKNTVLVLPKVPYKSALVRLGQSHTTEVKNRSEHIPTTGFKLPSIHTRDQTAAFPSCISLPINTVNMNPFHSPLDDIEELNTQPVLITLRAPHKYFVPGDSYVQQPQQTVAPHSQQPSYYGNRV